MNFVCSIQDSAISISNCCSDPYYFEQVSEFARNWPQDRIRQVRRELSASNPFRESVMRDLLELENNSKHEISMGGLGEEPMCIY